MNPTQVAMQAATQAFSFDSPDILSELERCSDEELDGLDFGVIGIDAETHVRRYNAFESEAAALSSARVLGHPLFTMVAPCMNNFMIAQRFEDALAAGTVLDTTLDYVLTLRMRPVKVKLRLVGAPGARHRYVLVLRRTA